MTKAEYIEKHGEEAYEKYKEQARERVRKWREEHPELERKRREDHRELHRELTRKWLKDYPERARENSRKSSRKHQVMFAYVLDSERELIENYELAAADEFTGWDLHHRAETEGTGCSVKELKEKGLYYNRPASELIFLTWSEHTKLHLMFRRENELL